MPKETINPDGDGFIVQVGWQHGGSMQVGIEGKAETLLRQLYGDDESLARIGDAAARLIQEVWQTQGGVALGSKVLDLIDHNRSAVTISATSVGPEPPETPTQVMLYASPAYRSVWSHLDRQGCNHLIRILRRARDATFGRDE